MQKILRKRVLRDLRENLFRYLALGFLIIVGMYIIVSLVGAADTIMCGTAQKATENRLEDGEFSVFVPLTDGEKEALEKEGVVLEEHFYLEYNAGEDAVVRVFANRETIDRVELEDGRSASEADEIVLEKRYCEENNLSVGDTILLGERNFQICGIGTAADYEAPYRKLSDSAVDSRQFGIGFVTEETYDTLRAEGKSIITEEYVYAYRLEGDMTERELKSALKEMTVSPEQITDSYFSEYWDQTGGKKEEFEDALTELADGAKELSDGMEELSDGAVELSDGAEAVKDGAMALSDGITEWKDRMPDLVNGINELADGGSALTDGMGKITTNNDALIGGTVSMTDAINQINSGLNAIAAGYSPQGEQLAALLQGLTWYADALETTQEPSNLETAGYIRTLIGTYESMYQNVQSASGYMGQLSEGAAELQSGVLAYTQGVSSAADGAGALNGGLNSLKDQTPVLSDGVTRLSGGAAELAEGTVDLSDGADSLSDGIKEAADGAAELADGAAELKEEAQEFLDEYFTYELSNLIQFIPAEDNMRIGAAADDQIINKAAGLVAGVIILILFTYVISVFVVHGIEQEASIIGTLYAMGVKRKELLMHYLTLPVVVTGIAGIVGTVLGYSSFGIDVQMEDCYAYFSMPSLATVYAPYLLVYGILMPPVVAALVNYFVIRKKLAQPALKLIRNEQKARKSKGSGKLAGGKLGFVKTFQIRQMLRELRTAFTVFFGLFISLLIVMLSVDCYVLCEHISVENKRDTKFTYMYTYKYPESAVPDGGEAAYGKTLKREAYGYNHDVTLLGIEPDNPYFDAPVEEGKSRVLISSAMAQKYNLGEGDSVVLSDEEQEMDYAFTVDGIVPYSTGFYAFMDIDSMRELMGESEDYYNVVFSDHDLGIDSGRLYATVTKEEIEKSADVFVELMMSMIITMGVVSVLIFVVVMYLMMKVMIDRSAFSISLMKIFGYRTKEIRKLYLNGNFYIVTASALIGIPLSKAIMDAMYPYMVANVACGMNLSFTWQIYAGIFGSILLLYFVINRMLTGRLKKLVPAEVLKNRE